MFSFMLLGGGASYHFLVELLVTPYTGSNSHLWKVLRVEMLILMSAMLSTAGLIFADKFIWPRNGVLAIVSLLLGYGALWVMSSRVERAFKAIRSNNGAKTVSDR